MMKRTTIPVATRTVSNERPVSRSRPKRGAGNSFGITPIATSQTPDLQRKLHCACGGSCPRCEKDLPVQPKLKIGAPNDKYEQEADRVADQVMSMPDPTVQRQANEGEEEEEEEEKPVQTKPIANIITPLVQRQAEPEEEEEEAEPEREEEEEPVQTKPLPNTTTPLIRRQPEPEEDEEAEKEGEEQEKPVQTKSVANTITPFIQRQAEPEENEEAESEEEEGPVQTKPLANKPALVTAGVKSQIQSLKRSGQPLPGSERTFFEPRFGADFSHVRIHSDPTAVNVARSINARAFTQGRDVVFGAGHHAPETSVGKRLLAHELVHVVQQKGPKTFLPFSKDSFAKQSGSAFIQLSPVSPRNYLSRRFRGIIDSIFASIKRLVKGEPRIKGKALTSSYLYEVAERLIFKASQNKSYIGNVRVLHFLLKNRSLTPWQVFVACDLLRNVSPPAKIERMKAYIKVLVETGANITLQQKIRILHELVKNSIPESEAVIRMFIQHKNIESITRKVPDAVMNSALQRGGVGRAGRVRCGAASFIAAVNFAHGCRGLMKLSWRLYNKLVELSRSPESFIWRKIARLRYTRTRIARLAEKVARTYNRLSNGHETASDIQVLQEALYVFHTPAAAQGTPAYRQTGMASSEITNLPQEYGFPTESLVPHRTSDQIKVFDQSKGLTRGQAAIINVGGHFVTIMRGVKGVYVVYDSWGFPPQRRKTLRKYPAGRTYVDVIIDLKKCYIVRRNSRNHYYPGDPVLLMSIRNR